MGTVLYKNTAKNAQRARYMTSVEDFKKGMQYTDAPLEAGAVKMLVNWDIKNDGEVLAPRKGLCPVGSAILADRSIAHTRYAHYTPSLIGDVSYLTRHGEKVFEKDAGTVKIIGCTVPDASKSYIRKLSDAYFAVVPRDAIASAILVKARFENSATFTDITDPTDYEIWTEASVSTGGRPSHPPINPRALQCQLGSTLYCLLRQISTGSTAFYRVSATQYKTGHTVDDYYTVCFKKVLPQEINPASVVNNGYNMLLDNPYQFANHSSSLDVLQLLGIIPQDANAQLMLHANTGQTVHFRLVYDYPAADVATEKYKVQWEIQDLDSNKSAEIAVRVRESEEYAPGADIVLKCRPAYKHFAVTAKVYKVSKIAQQDAEWEANTALQSLVTKDDYLTPEVVTTLASYYLNSTDNNKLTPVKYTLGTATGMCTWQQRVVLWGVNTAEDMLFVSDINNPSYFPYPNNCDVFPEPVVKAVPYLSDLAVFTTHAVYLLSFNSEGVGFTKKCVQDGLNIAITNADTIVNIQNMLYFRAYDRYYMLVPNMRNTGNNTVKLAPVSTPILNILADPIKFFKQLLKKTYNIQGMDDTTIVSTAEDPISSSPIDASYLETYLAEAARLTVTDNYCYSTGDVIHNIYKVAFYQPNENNMQKYGVFLENIVYIDIDLLYDTATRTWRTYCYQSNASRMVLLQESVTEDVLYVLPVVQLAHGSGMEVTTKDVLLLLYFDTYTCADAIEQVPFNNLYKNYQYLETGYRDFSEDMKKRFREVQYCINTLDSGALTFHTGFVIDDVCVSSLYNEAVVTQNMDVNSAGYGEITIEHDLLDVPAVVDVSALDTWKLDVSAFTDITVHKVRYKVAGKGYGGNVLLLSTNETPFELLHINWVYRVMFAR